MRIHYIQHVPFEGLGSMEPWFTNNGHTITRIALWNGDAFPSTDDLDVLVIMGGPMNVYDEPLYPWLAPEKAFIQQAIHNQKIVIGICLGAQLIAAALGAKVYRNPLEEIGWFPVQIAPSLSQWLKKTLPAEMTVFHWHGDTFDLPGTAINHISSTPCAHQLYTCGDRILGIQFHPEATPAAVLAMVDHEGEELSAAPYVQDRETILSSEHYDIGNTFLQTLLTRMFQ